MAWYLIFLQQAVEKYNTKEIDGRKIVVCRAQKKQERAMELKAKFEQQKMERITRYQGGYPMIHSEFVSTIWTPTSSMICFDNWATLI